MTRNRGPRCRCCGMPAESTYCGPCGANHVRHAAVVHAVILAIWGTAGLASYETELRAQRLARRRATKPGRKGRAA